MNEIKKERLKLKNVLLEQDVEKRRIVFTKKLENIINEQIAKDTAVASTKT